MGGNSGGKRRGISARNCGGSITGGTGGLIDKPFGEQPGEHSGQHSGGHSGGSATGVPGGLLGGASGESSGGSSARFDNSVELLGFAESNSAHFRIGGQSNGVKGGHSIGKKLGMLGHHGKSTTVHFGGGHGRHHLMGQGARLEISVVLPSASGWAGHFEVSGHRGIDGHFGMVGHCGKIGHFGVIQSGQVIMGQCGGKSGVKSGGNSGGSCTGLNRLVRPFGKALRRCVG
jgi:hypothetical protein